MLELAAYYNEQRQRALQVNPVRGFEGEAAPITPPYTDSSASPRPDQLDIYSSEDAQTSRRTRTPPRLLNSPSV